MPHEEMLSIGRAGWVRWISPGYGSPRASWVRFAAAATGRLVATAVYVEDDELGTEALRRIPLPRLERWVNRPDVKAAIEGWINEAGPDMQTLKMEPEDKMKRPRVSPRITVPERKGRSPYPASFYRRVAEVVSAGWSARAIAEVNEVPVSTATRWIKGARERGLLAAGRKR